MPLDARQEREFTKLRIVALALALAPLIYLIVAYALDPGEPEASVDLLFYLLLLIALLSPVVAPIIERSQVKQYRTATATAMTPAQLYTTTGIIKLAFAEACFTYGLVVYFLTADMLRMLYFYPIGIAWMAIYWPRRDRFEQFLKKVTRP